MEVNVNPNEPAKLTPTEVTQVAQIMERIKNSQKTKPHTGVIQPVTKSEIPMPDVVPLPLSASFSPLNAPARLTQDQYNTIKSSVITLPPELQAKVQDAAFQQIANERAQREPLPAQVEYVFKDDNIEVEVFNLDTKSKEIISIRRYRHNDIRIWKLDNSPIYQLMMGDLKTETEVDKAFNQNGDLVLDIVYQFINPVREVIKLIDKSVTDFRGAALDLGNVYSSSDITKLFRAIVWYINFVNSSRVDFTGDVEDSSGDKKKQE